MLAANSAPGDYAGDQTLSFRLRKLPKLLHNSRITIQVSDDEGEARQPAMLRKLLWSGMYAGLAAGIALVSRQTATKIWRLATGEAPPAKR